MPTIANDDPLYPMFLYIYEKDGMHGDPVQINSEAQLHDPGTVMILKIAMQEKREIRITDPNDFLLFHAQDGKILFDGKEHYPEGRAV